MAPVRRYFQQCATLVPISFKRLLAKRCQVFVFVVVSASRGRRSFVLELSKLTSSIINLERSDFL